MRTYLAYLNPNNQPEIFLGEIKAQNIKDAVKKICLVFDLPNDNQVSVQPKKKV